MAEDRKLGRNFWLHEFPCWEMATPSQVAQLQETVSRVLQPTRDRWGPVVPTSWRWWSDGCELRSGAHGQHGGTVDFTTPDADLREVWEWGRRNLLPAGYIGRWIYEPERRAAEGRPQGEHIHMATVEDMVAHNGDARILALEETSEGTYVLREAVEAVQAGAGPIGIALAAGLAFTLARGRGPAPA